MKKLVNAILDFMMMVKRRMLVLPLFMEFKIIFSHTFYNSSKNDSIDCLISEKRVKN